MEGSNSMKPIDVGAPKLIPQGNLDPAKAGSYGAMRKALDDAMKNQTTSRSTLHPEFKPGYYGDGLQGLAGEWQTTTVK